MFKKIKIENENKKPSKYHSNFKEIDDYYKNIAIFTGGIDEYERFRGYKCEFIDTKRPEKYICIETMEYHLREELMKESIEAIVDCKIYEEGHQEDIMKTPKSDDRFKFYGHEQKVGERTVFEKRNCGIPIRRKRNIF